MFRWVIGCSVSNEDKAGNECVVTTSVGPQLSPRTVGLNRKSELHGSALHALRVGLSASPIEGGFSTTHRGCNPLPRRADIWVQAAKSLPQPGFDCGRQYGLSATHGKRNAPLQHPFR